MSTLPIVAVIPAAGIGKRVGAEIPKQYLPILGKAIIEHSIQPFLDNPRIAEVIVSLASNDQWFNKLAIAQHEKVKTVQGGAERVDSVLSALKALNQASYVLVHDAARPCLDNADVNSLIDCVLAEQSGAILAVPVRDTMKRSNCAEQIDHTVDRANLWHALTPQMFSSTELIAAIESNQRSEKITDEASAMEMAGQHVKLLAGNAQNIKVTQPEDLLLAEFYLTQRMKEQL